MGALRHIHHTLELLKWHLTSHPPLPTTPPLAGAIVLHAESVCETADHLWRVLGDVSIPTEGMTDSRQQHKVTFGTEPMARVESQQGARYCP